jgi:hypothetical protein
LDRLRDSAGTFFVFPFLDLVPVVNLKSDNSFPRFLEKTFLLAIYVLFNVFGSIFFWVLPSSEVNRQNIALRIFFIEKPVKLGIGHDFT